MSKKVVPFRRIKHGEPRRLKVLVEDMTSSRTARVSVLVIVLAALVAFGIGYLVG